MVKKMLERAIEIEGLLRIIRDGNPLPEIYTLLSNKLVELTEEAMMLEERAALKEPEISAESSDAKSEHMQDHFEEEANTIDMPEHAEKMPSGKNEYDEEASEEEIINKATKESPKGIPIIVMTNDHNATTEELKIESHKSPQPILNLIDVETTFKESNSEETGMAESLSEAEEEIEGLADVEVTISHETETPNRLPSFAETAEDEDILFNFEEDEIEEVDESGNQEEYNQEHNQKIAKNETTGIKRQKKLKSAFSLNDRFLYARELFEGNMKMFDSTLDFIEGIEDYSIIEDYFYNELEWDPENGAVASFMEILRPQFKD